MPITLHQGPSVLGITNTRAGITLPSSGAPPPVGFGGGAAVWSDTFTYSDTASINGVGGWYAPGISGSAAMGVATNALQRVSGSGWAAALTSKADFARGIDVVFEIAATPDTTNQMILAVFGGASGSATTGYAANINMANGANTRCRLQRFASGSVQATHVDVTDAVVTAGSAIGLRITTDTVALWRRIGGTWAQVGATVTDTTLTTGSLSIETNAGATRIDAVSVTVAP